MAIEFETVIGLEIHAELSTKTKIFCGCSNIAGREPNTNVCPICLGFPGTLPMLNKQVVEYAMKMGHATNCTINGVTKQDRKHYFYPDLGKAYQISQLDIPLCAHGYLDVLVGDEVKRIRINRIHVEEDAGKLIHDENYGGTLVDNNRSGAPLIEIVSEPDMRSADEAKAYLETIRKTLLYLGISDAKMEEGRMRCDVNVSVMPKGSNVFGTRIEMKNLSSLSAVHRAINYESRRQIDEITHGGTLVQSTRRWDDVKGRSYMMRSKENAQDYRYFPDPDMLTYVIPQEHIDAVKASIPELPVAKTLRYMKDFSLSRADAELLARDRYVAEFFDDTLERGKVTPKGVANWLLGDISKVMNERHCGIQNLMIKPWQLAKMVELIESKKISNAAGKSILDIIIDEDRDPEEIVKEKGLAQVSDTGALQAIVDKVIANNEKAVSDIRAGKMNAVGFLVGQCMKESKGQGNPGLLREMIIATVTK